MCSLASVSINSCMTSRTDSRIRSAPSPARNASSSSDATDLDNAIGGNLLGEYLAVHTENPADGPPQSRLTGHPKPHHARGLSPSLVGDLLTIRPPVRQLV